MKNAENINLFFDRLIHSDQYIMYDGSKYFIEGCCCQFDESHQIISATLTVYQLPSWKECYSVTSVTPDDCVNRFISDFRLNGRTIHELIPDIEIVDE